MDADRLRSIPLFAELSAKERDLVAQHADEVDVAAGRHVIREGELGWEFFVIESGAAEVRIRDEQVATLGPGDFFGEVALKDESQRRTASVIAIEPSRLIVMTRPAFRTVDSSMPAVASKIREAAERYRS